MTDAKTEAEALCMFGPISPCTCWTKAPTVPVFRDRHDHLSDCPLKGSGLPVGVAYDSLTDSAKRANELAAECERLREAMRPFAEAFEKRKEFHLADDPDMQQFHDENRATPPSDVGMWRRLWLAYQEAEALQEPPR